MLPTPIFGRCIRATSSSCGCAGRCSRPAIKTARTPRRTGPTSSASSSIWSAGGGCRKSWARCMCGSTHRSSCCMWSRTGRRSSGTRLSWARSAMRRLSSPPDMQTIVFNPDWVAPPSVLQDKLLPALRRKSYNILKSNKLLVSYQGKSIDPTKVDWNRVNIHSFTFSQRAGPKNVLGKAKFLYPNKHIVYMHDTLPYRQKVFKEENRAIGYGCVRMQKPKAFAELLLAEDRDWPASKVADLWDKGVNSPVTLDAPPPVHTTYFTAVVDDKGKIETHPDLYGLDRALAIALFGDAQGFPEPPPEPEPKRPSGTVASASARNTGGGGGFTK